MADITLVNLNMLFMRYGEEIERELHVPLGPLYLTRALEEAGFTVDFRDYQLVDSNEPFDRSVFLEFLREPADIIGLSCMANLLPFAVLAMRALKETYPGRTIVLGGVGSKAVEHELLERFPWIDVICRGEGERTGPELLRLCNAVEISPRCADCPSAATVTKKSFTRPTGSGSRTWMRSLSRRFTRSTCSAMPDTG